MSGGQSFRAEHRFPSFMWQQINICLVRAGGCVHRCVPARVTDM